MTKVKIFGNFGLSDLEEQINQFIQDKKVIDVKMNSVEGPAWRHIACIIYEDE